MMEMMLMLQQPSLLMILYLHWLKKALF